MDWNIVWITMASGALVWLLLSLARMVSGNRHDASGVDRDRRYHAVAIRVGPDSCPQAEKIKGQRFLSREAPLLPLSGCASRDCHCVYAHFPDRRHFDRRFGFADSRYRPGGVAPDRRGRGGRRRSDAMDLPGNYGSLA